MVKESVNLCHANFVNTKFFLINFPTLLPIPKMMLENCQNGSVILIDDMVDSKWTLTVCGSLLKDNGANLVYPFTIASTAGGSGDE